MERAHHDAPGIFLCLFVVGEGEEIPLHEELEEADSREFARTERGSDMKGEPTRAFTASKLVSSMTGISHSAARASEWNFSATVLFGPRRRSTIDPIARIIRKRPSRWGSSEGNGEV